MIEKEKNKKKQKPNMQMKWILLYIQKLFKKCQKDSYSEVLFLFMYGKYAPIELKSI